MGLQGKNGRQDIGRSTGANRNAYSLELLRALQNGNPHKGKAALEKLHEAALEEVVAPSSPPPTSRPSASLARGGWSSDIERDLHDSNPGCSSSENKLLTNGACAEPQEHGKSSHVGPCEAGGTGRLVPSSHVSSCENGKSMNWIPFQFDRTAIMDSLRESVYGNSLN